MNLFADMGAQPGDAACPDLTAASASTDTTAPTSTISVAPEQRHDGTQVDDLRHRVRHRRRRRRRRRGLDRRRHAPGTRRPAPRAGPTRGPRTATPRRRSRCAPIDDSGNLQTPGAGVTVNVNCPCSLWGTSTTVPAADADSGDPTPVEVGVKFKSDSFGTVTGVRFYKAAANTGTHIGSLWSADGHAPGAGDLHAARRAPGWQTVTFATPGRRSRRTPPTSPPTTRPTATTRPRPTTSTAIPRPGPTAARTADAPPLHAVRNTGTDDQRRLHLQRLEHLPDQLASARPTTGSTSSSRRPRRPGQVTNVSAVAGGKTSANVTWSAPATGGAVTSYKITPYVGATAQTPTTINGSPPATTTTITGLTTGHDLHVHGAGDQPDRLGAACPRSPTP